ncbi:MAG: hypothetical protein AUJ98_08375 [Bacteroidetes bacterium CG2_30_33_31]|nr:MAG: hypothetical protein AUJ98_08375 [Bacteroidetes bacterium CG2_30_33_31]
MARRELKVIGISNSQTQSGAYALILGDSLSSRRIPIIIGAYEAQAIALHIEGMQPSRPMTHDLIMSFFDSFNIKLKEIVINRFSEGIFYSLLICEKKGKVLEIDSRTSDAVALAIRFGVPIYCDEEIIDKTSVDIEIDADFGEEFTADDDDDNSASKFEDLSDEELIILLNESVEDEDFEQASLIRDILNKRKGDY